MVWAPNYITKTQLAGFMRIGDSADDTWLDTAVAAASRAIDKRCNRQFGSVAAIARQYTAYWSRRRGRWVIPVDDFQTIAGLTVTVPAGTVDIVTAEEPNSVQEGLAYTRLVVDPAAAFKPCGRDFEVTVTLPWGWTAIPDAVTEAAYLQGSRFHSRRDSPYGVAGSPQDGSELRLLAKLDPDVAVALTRYVRPRRWR